MFNVYISLIEQNKYSYMRQSLSDETTTTHKCSTNIVGSTSNNHQHHHQVLKPSNRNISRYDQQTSNERFLYNKADLDEQQFDIGRGSVKRLVGSNTSNYSSSSRVINYRK